MAKSVNGNIRRGGFRNLFTALIYDHLSSFMNDTLKPAPKGLHGLQKVCRMFGSMKCGDTLMVWDYVAEEAVPEKEMPLGSKRWRASEKAKWIRHDEKLADPAAKLTIMEKTLGPQDDSLAASAGGF